MVRQPRRRHLFWSSVLFVFVAAIAASGAFGGEFGGLRDNAARITGAITSLVFFALFVVFFRGYRRAERGG